MKVICIDATGKEWCIKHGITPLVEGEIYTVREHVIGARGEGYLFCEIHNEKRRGNYYSTDEPSYHKRRFVPLSEIDEMEYALIEINEQLKIKV